MSAFMGIVVLLVQLISVSMAVVCSTSTHGLHEQLSPSGQHNYDSCVIFEPAPPASPDNPSPFLGLVVNPNGTLTRPFFSSSPSNQDPAAAVFSADIILNAVRGTSLRVYVPQSHANHTSTHGKHNKKLPTIVFFHGGGFVLFSTAAVAYHQFCERLSANLSAVVVSVGYRLAPESRLPAAYQDATQALYWLHLQATAGRSDRHPVLRRADLSRWFLMGGSAGGNIVFRVGLDAALNKYRRSYRNRIAGLIMYQPFFGGVCRTASELARFDDPVIPLQAKDLLWELALPEGATRDHPFAHPKKATKRMAKSLVTGNVDDPLIDWQRKFAKLLEDEGVEVIARLDGNGLHGAELFDPSAAQVLVEQVRAFIVTVD